ncbi:hypothetical protein Tco_0813210 [Tanacetum coccineum]
MSSITAQQAKLDLELVPKEKRLDIGKCNRRLSLGKIQREPTFQVALALTPCYSAFLITADVLEVYMHQLRSIGIDIPVQDWCLQGQRAYTMSNFKCLTEGRHYGIP